MGRFIYQSIIPVTLGNLLGGAVSGGAVFWYMYRQDVALDSETGQPLNAEKNTRKAHRDPIRHSALGILGLAAPITVHMIGGTLQIELEEMIRHKTLRRSSYLLEALCVFHY